MAREIQGNPCCWYALMIMMIVYDDEQFDFFSFYQFFFGFSFCHSKAHKVPKKIFALIHIIFFLNVFFFYGIYQSYIYLSNHSTINRMLHTISFFKWSLIKVWIKRFSFSSTGFHTNVKEFNLPPAMEGESFNSYLSQSLARLLGSEPKIWDTGLGKIVWKTELSTLYIFLLHDISVVQVKDEEQ